MNSQRRRASEQGPYLVAVVVGMVGLTYASVPLYRMFCQATGFGGTVQEGKLRVFPATSRPVLRRAASESSHHEVAVRSGWDVEMPSVPADQAAS